MAWAKIFKKKSLAPRNLIEQSILWTDIARHKEQMEKIEALVPQINSSLEKARGGDNRVSARGATTADLLLQKKSTRVFTRRIPGFVRLISNSYSRYQ